MLGWRRKVYRGWEVDIIDQGPDYWLRLTIRRPDGTVLVENENSSTEQNKYAMRVAKRLISEDLAREKREASTGTTTVRL